MVLNGINTDKFFKTFRSTTNIRKELNIPSDAIVIGLACVFRVQKRLIVWLEIAQCSYISRFPNVILSLLGDGPFRNQIYAKAESLKCKSYVHFVGLQPEIRPYLQAMDIFMMSSEFEGLPIALLEAMSMEMYACQYRCGRYS